MASGMYLYLFGILLYCQLNWVTCHSDSEHDHETATPVPPISDHRFFLQEIFSKYGHAGQMTFEGFEHLMESLGLGNIIISDHDVAAHKKNPDISIHDTHDHMKKMDHVDITTPKVKDHNQNSSELSTTPIDTFDRSYNKHHRHNHNSIPPLPDSIREVKYHKISSTAASALNQNNAGKTTLDDGLYRYQLREPNIPELLVNISTLVDQHQELQARQPEIIIDQCLSPREILDAFGLNQTSSLNPVSFLHLCPAIIYELDQGHCLFREHSHDSVRKIPTSEQWLFASVAVLIISLCGLLSVAVIPIMQKWFYQTLLQFLVGLAIGSLSGDALLHLMPHAMLGGEGSHNHNNPLSAVEAEKSAVWRGFTALFGIFFFFVAERLLGAFALYRKRKNAAAAALKEVTEHLNPDVYNGNVGEKLSQYRKSSYQIQPTEKEKIKMFEMVSRKPSCNSLHSLELNVSSNYNIEPSGTVMYSPNPEIDATMLNSSHGHAHGHGHSHGVPDSISAVAWMVIMGDGLHNFCDGLAIGAAFASGIEGGISTAVAVFCHELPHELGDFAMLLKTGMKVREALLYNILSSVLCFIGMAIGVSLGNVHSATSWVFAATAGMFLYIALVDMLPELSSSGDGNISSTYVLAVQLLGICSGASIMLLIANYEQDLKNIIS